MAAGKIVGLIISAGESSRMGRLKALLPWDGVPLIRYQVDCLRQAGADLVIVVLGHRAEEIRPHVPVSPDVCVVVNDRYREGKTTSIKAGLAQVPPDAEGLVLVTVDQPRPMPLVAALIQTFRDYNAPVTQPTFGGRRGHPMVFRADVLPKLAGIREETQGIKPVVDSYRAEAMLVPVDSPIVLVDLNTEADYQRAKELWGQVIDAHP